MKRTEPSRRCRVERKPDRFVRVVAGYRQPARREWNSNAERAGFGPVEAQWSLRGAGYRLALTLPFLFRAPAAPRAASPPAASPSVLAPSSETPAPGPAGPSANFAPNDPPGEWRRQARDYANTRYSPLATDQSGNVTKLTHGLDVFRRRRLRSRRRATGHRPPCIVVAPFPMWPMRSTCQSPAPPQVDLRAEPVADRHRQGLL